MNPALPRLAPLGDAALTLTFGATLVEPVMSAAARAAEALRAAKIGGVREIVPAYVAVTIHYDLRVTTNQDVRDAVAAALRVAPDLPIAVSNRLVAIPVHYDGPDLVAVAAATRLSEADVIVRHARVEYRVAMLGFVPGFAYLGPLDPALVLPRHPTPRPRVPAGAVAIGGEQTGIYPAATPGGWHLIGHTPIRMFDPTRDPPAFLAVGDRVRFVPA